MNAKIAGVLIFLAGTATVFATTHASLTKDNKSQISGVASFISGFGKEINMEMEFVGLQPNGEYVARLENKTCQNLPSQAPTLSGGTYIAAFVQSNKYGSYSEFLKGLPGNIKSAKSVALYSNVSGGDANTISTVYCIDLG